MMHFDKAICCFDGAYNLNSGHEAHDTLSSTTEMVNTNNSQMLVVSWALLNE
jgi:hypothetical protein